jgi:uncharacterized repeat protein (TIGR01451 family)
MNTNIITLRFTRQIMAMVAMLALVMSLVPMQVFASGKTFTTSVNPSQIEVNTTETVVFTITNTSTGGGNTEIKSGRIIVPTGFEVSNLLVSQANWDIEYSEANSRIQFTDGQGKPNSVSAGQSFTVTADVTHAGAHVGSTNWTVCVFSNESYNPGEGAAFDAEDSQSASGCGIGLVITVDDPNPPSATADLSVEKVVDVSTPAVGDEVVYTITVTNNGPDAATNVVVTDTLPTGVTFVSADPVADSTGPLTWNVGPLANGADWLVDVTVTVDPETEGDVLTNSASVSSDVDDSDTQNNTDTADVTVAILGCMDSDASNYNELATKDDGSCLYPDERGTVTVVKAIDESSDDVEVWSFDFTGGLGTFTLSNATTSEVFPNLPVGEYTITETGKTNWTLTDISCGATQISTTSNSMTVTLVDGDDVTCTFTNSYSAPAVPVLGCTDSTATNYNPNATPGNADADDCEYSPIDVPTQCVVPNTLGDTATFTPVNNDETTLAEMFALHDYGFIDVTADEKNYQVWDVVGSNVETVTFDVRILGKRATNTQVFGYYKAGDNTTFTSLLTQADDTDGESPISVTIPATFANSFGFAISSEGDTWYSEISLNSDGKDHVAVYQPTPNTYLLAFEDLYDLGDADFNDLVIEVSEVSCTYHSPNGGDDGTTGTVGGSVRSSGGGSATRIDRTPEPAVAGDSDSLPTPQPTPMVLGEQVTAVPYGAPATGHGGTSGATNTNTGLTLAQLLLGARRTEMLK